MARVELPESKSRARRRRRNVIAIGASVVVILSLVGGFVWLTHETFWRISRIDIRGVQTVASSTVAEEVLSQLEGEYLYLFPKNNILFYPKGRISSTLLAWMPLFASVDVAAENFQTISVTVVERQPKAQWCGEMVASSSPCFLLDESGVAYGAALNFSGNVYTKYYGALMGSTTPKQYLSPAQFRSLSALVDTIAVSPWPSKQKNGTLASVWVDTNKDVRMAFSSGFALLFTLSTDGGDVYQRFTLALQSDPFTAHQLSDFEYLDLRFGDKLYYKLK